MPELNRINNFPGNLIPTKHFCSLLLMLPFFLVINVNLRRYFSNFMLMLFGRFCILKSISICMYLKLLIRVLLTRFHIVQKWKWITPSPRLTRFCVTRNCTSAEFLKTALCGIPCYNEIPQNRVMRNSSGIPLQSH